MTTIINTAETTAKVYRAALAEELEAGGLSEAAVNTQLEIL